MKFLKSVIEGDISNVKEYLTSGSSINITDREGNTALHLAKYKEILELLLKDGINPNQQNQKSETPLHCIFFFHRSSLNFPWEDIDEKILMAAKTMLKGGASPNIQDQNGRTVLHYVFLYAGIGGLNLESSTITELTKDFLEYGSDPNVYDYEQRTPIHYAVSEESTEFVELLLNAKADINKRCIAGCSSLHFVYCLENKKMTKFLLKHGANAMLGDKCGMTALHYSCGAGYVGITKWILQYCPMAANSTDTNNVTPLHLASAYKQTEIVDLLLSYGAYVNAVDRFNASPLHYAGFGGTLEIVHALLEAGADPTLKDDAANKPLDCALYRHYYYTAKVFSKDSLKKALRIPHGASEEEEDNAMLVSLPADDIFNVMLSKSNFEKKDLTDTSIFPKETILYFSTISKGNFSSYIEDIQTVPDLGAIPDVPEIHDIRIAVEMFVGNWVRCIENLDERFHSSVLNSGSIYEGTKVGHPYEYDYMVVLYSFQKYFNAIFDDESAFNDVKIYPSEEFNDTYEEFIVNGKLDSRKLVEIFASTARKALARLNYESGHSQLYINGFSEETYLHDTWVNVRTVTCNLKLLWIGVVWKHLSLSIDLVPALPLPTWPSIARKDNILITDEIRQQGCHLVSKDGKWRLSFSLAEQSILKRLSLNQRKAFIGAKTMLNGAATARFTVYDDTHLQKGEKKMMEKEPIKNSALEEQSPYLLNKIQENLEAEPNHEIRNEGYICSGRRLACFEGDLFSVFKIKDANKATLNLDKEQTDSSLVIKYDDSSNVSSDSRTSSDNDSLTSSDIDTFTFEPRHVITTYLLKITFLQLLHENTKNPNGGMVTTKQIIERLFDHFKNKQPLSYYFIPEFNMITTIKNREQEMPKMLLVLSFLNYLFEKLG